MEVTGETLVTGLKVRVYTPGSHTPDVSISHPRGDTVVNPGLHPGGEQDVGEERVLEVGGIFVEIGSVPNSEMVKDLVQLDDHKQIMVNFQYARTSHPGIFAAGDVTNDPYKQNNISAGDGVRAALSAYDYLLNREKKSPAEERV